MKKLLVFSGLLAFASPSLAEGPGESGVDYGDSKSVTLVVKAWGALDEGQYEDALMYTERCAALYEEEAKKMQASLGGFPSDKVVNEYGALNDVGTCYFISGEALMKLNRRAEAVAAYKAVRDEFSYSQAWDPKGWYWSVSLVAEGKIDILENPSP